MKEITVCFKAEVTKVVKGDEDKIVAQICEEKAAEIKKALDADDVHVSHLKYFVRDLEVPNEQN